MLQQLKQVVAWARMNGTASADGSRAEELQGHASKRGEGSAAGQSTGRHADQVEQKGGHQSGGCLGEASSAEIEEVNERKRTAGLAGAPAAATTAAAQRGLEWKKRKTCSKVWNNRQALTQAQMNEKARTGGEVWHGPLLQLPPAKSNRRGAAANCRLCRLQLMPRPPA